MKIFFNTSPTGLQKNKDFCNEIIRFLTKDGHEVISGMAQNTKSKDSDSLYSATMENIRQADVCIFEATDHTMLLGHQLTYAVERRIPTLVLIHEHAFDVFKVGGMSGYTSPFLKFAQYVSRDSIYLEIDSFLEKNSGDTKYRIDMNLSTRTHEALTQYATTHHITKVAVIKRILEEKMNSA